MRIAPFLVAILAASAACAHAPPATGLADPTVRSDARVLSEDAIGSTVVRYAPADRDVARQVVAALPSALAVAQRWRPLRSPVTITIHATHEALETAARRHGYAWLRAWSRSDSIELQSPRTWSRGAATDDEVAAILAHELTHCVLYQAAAGQGRGIPLWFREGMATTTAGEHIASVVAAGVQSLTMGAALYRTEPDLAYATADRAFRFLLARHGEERVRRLLRGLAAGSRFDEAFQDATGVSLEAFEREFTADVMRGRARG